MTTARTSQLIDARQLDVGAAVARAPRRPCADVDADRYGAGAGHGPGHANNGGAQVSPVNLFTIAMFLAWFGGTGYLLTRYSTIVFLVALLISIAVGTIGGTGIFLFMSRVLTSENENMDPSDYEMAGVLGRISSPIRAGGTGEIIYSQEGTRRTCGARSEDGRAIAKGEEVVVTRYEKGIAYVRLWEEMAGESKSGTESPKETRNE